MFALKDGIKKNPSYAIQYVANGYFISFAFFYYSSLKESILFFNSWMSFNSVSWAFNKKIFIIVSTLATNWIVNKVTKLTMFLLEGHEM